MLGLLYALLLNQSLKMKALTRTIVYLPVIISPLIMGYIWYFIFSYDGGALNDVLGALGIGPVNALASPAANPWIIVMINTYQYAGIAMIVYLAGLQSIPKDYYEAAKMDGAGRLQPFFTITLPLLMPAVTINMVINIIGGLKLFDVIFALTAGGRAIPLNRCRRLCMIYILNGRMRDMPPPKACLCPSLFLSSAFRLSCISSERRRKCHENSPNADFYAVGSRYLVRSYCPLLYFADHVIKSKRRLQFKMVAAIRLFISEFS